jgi:hypothetical protein
MCLYYFILATCFGFFGKPSLGKPKYTKKDKPYDLYSSPDIQVIKSRRMRWAGHVTCMGDNRGAYMVLVGRPEGKTCVGRHRHGWEDNIKMGL